MPADHRAGERSRDIDRAGTRFLDIHPLIETAEHDERTGLLDGLAHGVIVGLAPRHTCDGKGAGDAKIGFEEIPYTAGMGIIGHNPEGGCGEEVLRHRPPEIPERLQRRMLFGLDERLGVKPRQLAQ